MTSTPRVHGDGSAEISRTIKQKNTFAIFKGNVVDTDRGTDRQTDNRIPGMMKLRNKFVIDLDRT